ncbi:MAG: metalloregulator ArsR/SmtB family transcription factor [Candidatus Latescibacteria bacterium]|nr:metalloregulator ArsR/SmtB family transcription factor [Candidatus Latescibacterota bacterium]
MNNRSHRAFKEQLYDQFVRIGRALANPHRLELLDLLAQSERTVEDLAHEAGMSVANASQHLQTLRAAQLVEVRRDGLYGYYRLADDSVFRLWQAIRDVGETRLAEVERVVRTFLDDRDSLQAVSAEELVELLHDDRVIVLDVRPAEEYRAGHIPGARCLPVAELEARLRELPKNREIIAYCRGPYCVFADEAVALLRAHGYRARRFAQGLPDWRVAGLPVERLEGDEP